MTRANQISGRAYLTNGRAIGGSAIPDSGLLHDYSLPSISLSDGDPISSIPDDSGAGNDLSQAISDNQPTYRTNVQNGNAVARADGSDFMQATASLTQPFTFFVVLQVTDSDSLEIVYSQQDITNADFRVKNASAGNPWTIQNDIEGGSNNGSWVIIMAEHNGGSSQIQINGTQVASGTVADEDFSTSGLEVFAGGGGQFGLSGDVGRILGYDRSLSASEISDVFNFLNSEWAVY